MTTIDHFHRLFKDEIIFAYEKINKEKPIGLKARFKQAYVDIHFNSNVGDDIFFKRESFIFFSYSL